MIEQKIVFRERFDNLVKNTEILSGNFLSHPSAKKILEFDGTKAVPWLLEYLRECKQDPDNLDRNPWVAVEAIATYVPEEYLPYIPPSSQGKLNHILDIYDRWGLERNL